jgi:serine/threonine protein kinase
MWGPTSFKVCQEIGKGGFGTVRLAVTKCPHKFSLALKIIKSNELVDRTAKQNINREVRLQKSLEHRNILHLYGAFEDENDVYLMLELAKGSLRDRLAISGCGYLLEEDASQVSYPNNYYCYD